MEANTDKILTAIFKYRFRGDVQNHTPILFTDFDIKNLCIFEGMPPTDLNRWDDESAWSISVRPMTDEEFSDLNQKTATTQQRFGPVGAVMFEHEGEPVRLNGFIKRTPRDWVASIDIDEVKARIAEKEVHAEG